MKRENDYGFNAVTAAVSAWRAGEKNAKEEMRQHLERAEACSKAAKEAAIRGESEEYSRLKTEQVREEEKSFVLQKYRANSAPKQEAEIREAWNHHAETFNKEFARMKARYEEARKALYAQYLALVETQEAEIKRYKQYLEYQKSMKSGGAITNPEWIDNKDLRDLIYFWDSDRNYELYSAVVTREPGGELNGTDLADHILKAAIRENMVHAAQALIGSK